MAIYNDAFKLQLPQNGLLHPTKIHPRPGDKMSGLMEEEHELTSTFKHAGWTVKYEILSLSQSQQDVSKQKILVFVHGTPWSSVVFRPLVRSLRASASHRILLYDLPGYGQSQHLDVGPDTPSPRSFTGDTSVKAQATCLAALLSHLEIDGKGSNAKPAVLAHDIAGAIVLRAHLLLDCEFESMMLLDTNAVLPWGDGFYKLVREEPGVFARLPEHVFDAMLRAVVKSACHSSRSLENGWEEALVQPWRHGAKAQESLVRQIAQANDQDVDEMFGRGLYGHVRCGVTILWGEEDSWIPREKMEQFTQLLGTRLERFVVVKKAGHLLMLDQRQKVEEEVRLWLQMK